MTYNGRRFVQHLQEAAGNGAQLVVLPEMWNCPYSNDSFGPYSEDIDGAASQVLTVSLLMLSTLFCMHDVSIANQPLLTAWSMVQLSVHVTGPNVYNCSPSEFADGCILLVWTQ